MTKKENLFGTDGVRGLVNEFPMEPEIAIRLGLAAGEYFRQGKRRHKVIIGKDTRLSGYIFETALTSGLCASGMDVYLVGPLPTPAISFLTRNMRADLGIVISASHNPYYDNGIKFFDRKGFKLNNGAEKEISKMVLTKNNWKYPKAHEVGRAFKIEDSPGRYIVSLKHSFPSELTLDGIKIVLDCANGATYRVAPLVFEELGADVVKIGVNPNGLNINEECGALYPEKVRDMVLKTGADIGIALDGDGDRVILIDEKGKILDGDQIMAFCAEEMMKNQELDGGKLVATVMSNMALEIFMKDLGGELIRTPVGDRYVVEKMRDVGAVFGGEQSGHLIFFKYSTTGDGILAALQALKIMIKNQKTLSELAKQLQLFPQKLINVKVDKKIPFDQVPKVMNAVKLAEEKLKGKGRVLLRYSGTEPKARVMVEGEDVEIVESMALELAEIVKVTLNN
ncbi:phosphoglucosamine mutase [Desulfothermus naphthae]